MIKILKPSTCTVDQFDSDFAHTVLNSSNQYGLGNRGIIITSLILQKEKLSIRELRYMCHTASLFSKSMTKPGSETSSSVPHLALYSCHKNIWPGKQSLPDQSANEASQRGNLLVISDREIRRLGTGDQVQPVVSWGGGSSQSMCSHPPCSAE